MMRPYRGVHAGAWRYMLACPLLFAVPAAAEFVQHAIEMRIGMYDSMAAARAVAANDPREGWGVVKTLSLALAGYWVARFLLLDGAAAARRLDPVAVRLYLMVMLWGLVVTVLTIWGGDALRAIGLGAYAVAAGIGFALLSFLLNVMLAPWKVGAALGDRALGFVHALRLVGWRAWWGIILTLLTILPPFVAHYALLPLTIIAPAALKWALLAFDALVVGWLAAIIAATDVAIARDAAGRAREALAPA